MKRLLFAAMAALAPFASAVALEPAIRLSLSDPTQNNRFGTSVTVDSSLVYVGDSGADAHGITRAGAVQIFDLETGKHLGRFTTPDTSENSYFGVKHEIDGDYLVTAGVFENHSGFEKAGAVYVFNRHTGEQLHRITLPNPEAVDLFGFHIAVSDRRVLVVSRREWPGPGPFG